MKSSLFELKDEKNASFQAKLIPGVPRENIIGARVPEIRKIAVRKAGTPECETFLSALPHRYFDENILHACIISLEKNFDAALKRTDAFLPFVDNWAVCDTLSPSAFKRNHERLLTKIYEWTASKEVYVCRFGIRMLMCHFLDGDFAPELLEIPASVVTDEYYIMMMAAWFFATALAKQWDAALPYISGKRLEKTTHNKAIQKAVESRRISPERKELLKGLRV